jgi:hypothetical protein
MTRYALTALTCVLALAVAASAAYAASPKLTVDIGTKRTYTRSQLRPEQTVVCHYRGHTLSVAAPTGKQEGVGAGWPKPGTKDRSIFTLTVGKTSSRGFAVSCVRGGYHSALVTLP